MATFFALTFGIAFLVALVLYTQGRSARKQREQENRVLEQKLEESERENRELRQIKGKYEQLKENEKSLEKNFEGIAQKIFSQTSKELEERSKKSLGNTVEPLQKDLKTLRERMENINKETSNERTSLQNRIGETLETTQKLTQALTQKSQVRGSMGEMILQNALESLGLIEGQDFEIQVALDTEEGKRQFIDCVIHLPQGRKIILDSKFLLTDWHAHINSEDAEEREHLKRHTAALRRQVDDMAKRNYPASLQDALDFTLLFLPIDLAVYRAFESDPNLFQYAWKKQIGIISLSTLIPTIRIIDNLWQMDRQRGEHQNIIDHVKKMYDKFAGVLESHEKLGKQIETVRKTYTKTKDQLSSGTGSLHVKFNQLEGMGVRGSKRLPDAAAASDDSDDDLPDAGDDK